MLSGQVVLTVSYVDDLLLGWHRSIGVNRAFAPPVVSAGIVYSDTTASSPGSDDRSQGITLSIEDGFRSVIGDLGATVLMGDMIRGL